jgi:HEAT repeat protein
VNGGQTFLIVSAAICLLSASAVAAAVFARFRRGVVAARSTRTLALHRQSLIMMVSGEDGDGQAKAVLCAVPAATWAGLRPSVVAFLAKVRGHPADDLVEVMRAHGEVDQATKLLTSRSAVRRARGAYLLGLVRDARNAALVLPLLSDPAADVRLVAAQALGAIGDPSAAGGVLKALPSQRGQPGLPQWVAAEAMLAMGVEIGPLLQIGLVSEDPAVRNVCALVAGHGTYLSAAPQLRVLLATDTDDDVRVSAAVALGRVGGARDAAALAEHTSGSEPTALRRTCATALGDLGQREGMDELAGLLADDDRRLAELAGDSLVRIGDEGVAVLEVAAASRQGPSALAAGAALELARMRGRPVLSETAS